MPTLRNLPNLTPNRIFEFRRQSSPANSEDIIDGQLTGKDNLRNRLVITPSGSRQNLIVEADANLEI